MLTPRRQITPAARLIVPINAAFALTLGCIFVSQDAQRTSRMLDGIHDLGLSDHEAGWVLIVVAVIILLGMFTGYVDLAAIGCLAAGLAWLVVAATLLNPGPEQTQTGFVWPVYVGLVHLVSTVALMTHHGE